MKINRLPKVDFNPKGFYNGYTKVDADDSFNIYNVEVEQNYPGEGWVTNIDSNCYYFIRSGSGLVYIEDREIAYQSNDVIVIKANEKYKFEVDERTSFWLVGSKHLNKDSHIKIGGLHDIEL